MTDIERELYHHGIKGMKWGVRRYQNADGSLTPAGKQRAKVSNKQLRKESAELRKQYLESERKTSATKLQSLYDKVDELAKNYDFDLDDGGGGSSAASRKAGERYMRTWDKIAEIEETIDYNVAKKTGEALIEKYGKERIDRFETHENAVLGMKVVAAALAIPFTVGVISGLTSK